MSRPDLFDRRSGLVLLSLAVPLGLVSAAYYAATGEPAAGVVMIVLAAFWAGIVVAARGRWRRKEGE